MENENCDWHDRGPRGRHGWHRLEAMARRAGFGGPGGGFGGPGGGFAGWGGGFGDNMRLGRMLASGDLRLIALYLIEQQPRHGYDLIKAIEEKAGGIYSPSPGVIYPALTFLEEAGYVASTTEGNKRLYTITAEGRTHLDQNRANIEATLTQLGKVGEKMQKRRQRWEDMEAGVRQAGFRPDRDMDDVPPEVNDARRALKDAIRAASRNRAPDAQRELAAILRRAADDIGRIATGPDESEIDI
jgi:DNA-binding PadR family transcriptional regulator